MSGIFTIDFTDFTFTETRTSIWSVSEIGTAIVVASSPMLRPLFDKVFHNTSSSFRTGSNNPYDHSHPKSNDIGAGFGRLTDELPLTHLEREGAVAHRAQVIASSADSNNSLDEYHTYTQESNRGNDDFEKKIHVTVDTRIQRSEREGQR